MLRDDIIRVMTADKCPVFSGLEVAKSVWPGLRHQMTTRYKEYRRVILELNKMQDEGLIGKRMLGDRTAWWLTTRLK
ncbi:MAG: hypothetical protein K8L97_33535 [Anaerolineae bacterium]|nr:hypothetical protein [Anaerolineae bacterium]